jgi:N-hydroxyarylamine O-acetyltransferase
LSQTLDTAQVHAYLDRIGYEGSLDPSLDNLRALHNAHIFSVPFENLDMHLGRHVPVDVEHAFRKIVEGRRGGFCYELNPLFHALLSTLGYEVKIISARMLLRDEGHPFDHIATVVHLDDDWLIDVGYGRQPPPLRIAPHAQTASESFAFKLDVRNGEFVIMGSTDCGGYEALYGFSLVNRDLPEFEERAIWTQTSPDSIFTRAPICTLPTQDGRVTLSGMNFIRSGRGQVESRRVTAAERTELLKSIFGINLGDVQLPVQSDTCWLPGRGP